LNYNKLLEGCKIYVKEEPRDFIYKVASFLVSQFWGKPVEISEGLGVLLLVWNSAFYRYGQFDINELEKCVRKWYPKLLEYRERYIESLTSDDHNFIKQIYDDFKMALCRAEDKVFTPTGVSKALHLLAPNFFPIWDNRIADGYECYSRDSEDYLCFMYKMKDLEKEVINSYLVVHGGAKESVRERICWDLYPEKVFKKPLLKLMDEYNYSRYTLKALKDG